MKKWFEKNYKGLIIFTFLIPIVTVAVVSISHVTKWYGISNPISWAQYLSVGIEVAALSSLAAMSTNMGRKVYLPFFIVTLIQFIGNIYFAFSYIDINSKSFISWVELVSPLLEMFGVEPSNLVSHKRFLSFFEGGILPIISLTFLDMLVRFTENLRNNEIEKKNNLIETKFEQNINEEYESNTIRVTQEEFEKNNSITVTTIPNSVIEETNIPMVDVTPERMTMFTQPIIRQTPEPIIEVTPEPAVEPVYVPMIEVTPEPIIEVTPEPVVEPVYVPMVEVTPEPVVEITPEPVVEVIPEPMIEVTPEPVIEPIYVPMVEVTPEPVVEVTPEPVVEVAPEPVIEEKISIPQKIKLSLKTLNNEVIEDNIPSIIEEQSPNNNGLTDIQATLARKILSRNMANSRRRN